MPNDIKNRLRKAQKSVATWLIGANSNGISSTSTISSSSASNSASLTGKRISTPQLIKRTLHVAYEAETGNFIGVPIQWKSEFDKAASLADSQSKKVTPRDLQLVGRKEAPHLQAAMLPSTKGKNRVWYDQCNRKFVNLPTHWRERLLRNNLSDWPEFQRNPDLLTTIFTLMDEELRLMDLTSLGLDSSFYSSLPLSTAERENGKALDHADVNLHLPATEQQHQQSAGQSDESPEHQPDGNARFANGSRSAANTRAAAGMIVWTQQRSFARDDETDSDVEEFAEL